MAKTIRDVAKRAGVSIATVSRVLNNTAQVKDEKRLRVEEAVRALGFVPNQTARSLVQKKTKGVGVLLPSLGGEFFSEFLHGIDEASREYGRFVLISASHGSLEELDLALIGMRQRVDGLIIMSPEIDGSAIRTLIPDDTPTILVNGDERTVPFDTIKFDNRRGAYLATRHLLELGHRTIAVLKGIKLAYDSQERLQGFREALLEYGIQPAPQLELEGHYSPQGGYEACDALLALNPAPSAIFCANDQSAIGLMGALQNAGKKIPGDISVVGFDDIPGARFTSPPLTTVRVGIRQLGILAIKRLIEIDRESSPEHQVLPVELVIRHSTINFTSPVNSI